MNRLVLLPILLLAASMTAFSFQSGGTPAQQETGPITKQELISLIKQRGPERIPQGDIADMVASRGLAFKLDDQVLQELRAAGAQEFLIQSIKQSVADASMPRLHDRSNDAAGAPDASDAPPPRLSPEEMKRDRDAEIAKLPFLEQARVHALDFSQELPNFVVTQKVSRYIRSPRTRGEWVSDSRLSIEETYRVDKGEQLKLVTLNGKFATLNYDQLDGATSTGEFSASLGGIFVPESHTEFTEIKHVQFRGRDAVLYDFKVLKAHSTLTITDKTTKQSIVSGYTGSVWIDSETKRVLRVEESAEAPPPSFPITLSESAVDYDWVSIGGEKSFVPIHAEVLLGSDANRYYGKNVIDFVNYHKFEGDIKIIPESN